MKELRQRNDTWDIFLNRNGFHGVIVAQVEENWGVDVHNNASEKNQSEEINYDGFILHVENSKNKYLKKGQEHSPPPSLPIEK